MPASTWPITTRLMCVFSFTCDAGRARSRIHASHARFRVFACLRGCCRWPVQSLRLPQRPRGRKRRHRRHGGLRAYCLPRCDVARRLVPYYVWEQLGWRHGLETHHGCCMEPAKVDVAGASFHEPVLRFLKTRRLTAAGECLCGRDEGCCACFRASVGPNKLAKSKQKHSQIARPLGHNACEKSLFQSHRS